MRLAFAGLLLMAAAGRAQVITTAAGADWLFQADGQPAANAPLGGALGFAVAADTSGNVFTADADNNMVMRVGRDGVLHVVAGNGFAGWSGDGGPAVNAALALPSGIAIDSAGNLYVSAAHRIRKISADGTIETIAGNGKAGFAGDNGPALSASFNSQPVWRWTAAATSTWPTRATTAFARSRRAALSPPWPASVRRPIGGTAAPP